MTLFRDPEVATRFGALDDEAAQDGSPLDAHAQRELSRNGNRLLYEGGVMLQRVWRASNNTENQGGAFGFANPYWSHLLAEGSVPVQKKAHLNQARLRVRLDLTSGAQMRIFVASRERLTPDNRPDTEYLEVTGTGAAANYTKNDVIVRAGLGDEIAILGRAIITGSEAALVTGTYGTPAAGTTQGATRDSFSHASASWTAGTMPAAGYYVWFWESSSLTRLVYGPVKIVAQDSATVLRYWPPHPFDRYNQLNGSYFEIRKLPDLQVMSVSMYSTDGSP